MLSLYKNIIGCLLAMLFFTDSVFGQFTEPNIIHFDEEILRNPDSIPPGTSFIDRWGYPWNNPFARSAQVVFAAPHTCGRFSLTFADEGVTGKGFDDPSIVNLPAGHPLGVSLTSLGALRRWTACKVFDYISNVISVPPGTTPDILFDISETDGTGALAFATPFFSTTANPIGFYGGLLNQHIVTGIDPTPASGDFDAKITCDFGSDNSWYSNGVNLSFNSDAFVTSTQGIDVFTIILHEATHALGFFSGINSSGTSIITNTAQGTYSLFDRYLLNSATGNSNLVNNDNTTFNGSISQLTTPGIIDYFKSTNSKKYSVYSPSAWITGTSISHFDDRKDDERYIMGPSYRDVNRVYTKAELEALCNLGYTLTASGFSCADRYAIGVNDNGAGTTLTDPISVNVIANDFDSDGQEVQLDASNVQLLTDAGTISINGNTITLTPNGVFCGDAVIRYRPITISNGFTGSWATLTINIPCPEYCLLDPCNLVCNGSFEDYVTLDQFNFLVPSNDAWIYSVSKGAAFEWKSANDIHAYTNMRGANAPSAGIPLNYLSSMPPGIGTGNSSQNRYSVLFSVFANSAGSAGKQSGIYKRLIKPLEIDEAYKLTFNMYSVCKNNLNPNAICSGVLPSIRTSFSNIEPVWPSESSVFPGTNAIISPGTYNSGGIWTPVAIAFNATSASNYLIIEGGRNVYTATLNDYFSLPWTVIDDIRLEKVGNQISTSVMSSTDNPKVGQNTVFTIQLCNTGLDAVNNVTLNNILPAGFTMISNTFNAYPNHTFSTIGAAGCVNVVVTAQAQPSVSFNTDLLDCASVTSENSCTQTQACKKVRVLATNISVTATQENCNQFKIVISNTGSVTAHNLKLNYAPHSCFGYSSFTTIPVNAANYESNVITVPIIPAGSSVVVTITGASSSVPSGCINTVQLTLLDEYDINLNDNGVGITFEQCGGGGEGCIRLPMVQ